MACTYYCFKGGTLFGDYWCQKKDCRVDNETYYKYCRGYSYSDCPIFKYQESSGCFLTTVTSAILGKKDNQEELNKLRWFRDNILQKDTTYTDILKEYDVIGPVLADKIIEDENRTIMAQIIFNSAICPIVKLIDEKKYTTAVEKYYLMTLMLINYYGLKDQYNHLKDIDYDYSDFKIEKSGHGRVRKI